MVHSTAVETIDATSSLAFWQRLPWSPCKVPSFEIDPATTPECPSDGPRAKLFSKKSEHGGHIIGCLELHYSWPSIISLTELMPESAQSIQLIVFTHYIWQ